MTTILATFIISLTISLVLTPFITKAGIRYGLLDMPNERKVHEVPVPRIGGIAIFLSFISTLIIINLFNSNIISLFSINHQMSNFLLGGIIVFGIGVYDDIKSLRASVKLFFQILSASIAFYGGLQINGFDIFSTTVNFGLFSYFITVFWFLLFINAVNLADGLDGLAAGIVFFACLVMIVLLIIRGEYLVAMITAILGGSTLGFLKYNFNPASIYLGDGGSYFLGYTIAALSIMGTFKSQVSAVMLLPLVALGVPLFDTLIAPIRRFVYGNKLFRPDSDHIHHRLIKKGLTHYGAVIVIYATTFILCLLALILVNIRDEQAGLILIMLGFCALIIIQKLGYFEYFAVNKIKAWLRGISDEIGFSRGRRTFLMHQVNISNSKDLTDLWKNICITLEELTFDMAKIHIDESTGLHKDTADSYKFWQNHEAKNLHSTEDLLKIEIPLMAHNNNKYLGTLSLFKNLKTEPMDDNALHRITRLNNNIVHCIEDMVKKQNSRLKE